MRGIRTSALYWLRTRPALALVVMGIFGGGVGAATAMYSLMRAVALEPLPVRDPDRLVWMWNARTERDRAPFSIADLRDYAGETAVLESVAAFTNWTANLTGTNEPERLEGLRVDPTFFQVSGVQPPLGRLFSPDDARRQVAVITNAFWRRRFGADPGIVGRVVMMNGTGYEIIGVLPRGFLLPFPYAVVAVPASFSTDPRAANRGAGFLRVLARLRPGVTIAEAKSHLDTIGHRLQQQYPVDDAKKTGVNLFPLKDEIVGDARRLTITLFVAVAILVAVACANVGNLLLVGLTTRRVELATRIALGASRASLMRLLLAETATLCAAGALGGVWLSVYLVRAIVWWAGPSLPNVDTVAIDGHALTFSMAATIVGVILCGTLPAFRATEDLAGIDDESRATAAPRQQRLRHVLILAQVALSIVLVSAMRLAATSVHNLQHVQPGFDAHGRLTVQLALPPTTYKDVSAIAAFVDRLQPALSALPGVNRVGAVSLLPLSGLLNTNDFRIVGRPEPPQTEVPQAHYRVATPGYFEAAGIRLREGRTFTDDDREIGAPVAVVGRTLADRFWPGGGAVGAHLVVENTPTPVEIVGVVDDVKQFTLDRPPTMDLYVPLRQMPAGMAPLVAARLYWVIAGPGDPLALGDPARQVIRGIDGDVAASEVRTFEQLLAESVEARRFSAVVLAVFGSGALCLAALGIYGVSAFAVTRRTREIGIRVALGASPHAIMRLVALSELTPVFIGIGVGAASALAALTILSHTLFGVHALDSWRGIAFAAGAIGSTAMVACWLPARRAVRIDPTRALRAR